MDAAAVVDAGRGWIGGFSRQELPQDRQPHVGTVLLDQPVEPQQAAPLTPAAPDLVSLPLRSPSVIEPRVFMASIRGHTTSRKWPRLPPRRRNQTRQQSRTAIPSDPLHERRRKPGEV